MLHPSLFVSAQWYHRNRTTVACKKTWQESMEAAALQPLLGCVAIKENKGRGLL